MKTVSSPSLPGALGLAPGFLLRTVASDEDVERYAELNQSMAGEGEIARRLILHRPGAARGDFLMAVEESTGRVVSTTCLLRWRLLYEGVPLRTSMLEMVVTDPGYRRHGLVRAQIDRFHERARELASDLCIIQGIPYYYRQFGYAYALDHSRSVTIPAHRAAALARSRELRLRPCEEGDEGLLVDLYNAEMSRQGLQVIRGSEDWDYLQVRAGRTAQIVEHANGGPAGYVVCRRSAAATEVLECGLRDPASAPSVLALLGGQGTGRLEVAGNRAHALCRAAEDLGGEARVPDQWLVRLADPRGIVERLAPVLEGRLRRAGLAASGTAASAPDASAPRGSGPSGSGPTLTLTINFYRSAIRLRLVDGRLAAVEDAGFVDSSNVH